MTAAAVVERWPLVGRWGELETFDAALDACDGLVVFGPAGVGKTRLADELGARSEHAGRTTLRAVASKTAATAPLGALAHVLPPGASGAEGGEVFTIVADAFAVSRPVLVVDDLHLLDATSLTLLAQLVANGLVFLVGSVRSDEPRPDGVDALLRSDRVTRIDLDALARDDVETLLHLTLGGPVEGTTSAALWDASQGNVLFLRELVLAARASGTLRDLDGVWTLAGTLASSGRLAEVLAARLAAVDDDAKPVLELLACAGPIGLADAEQVATLDALASLEQQRLVTITRSDRRRVIALAHPLYGEQLRASLGVVATRTVLADQAARVQAHGARRREDPLLVATWQLEAGVAADRALLLHAARLARFNHDFPQCERLARALLREVSSPEGVLLLGEALYELGKFDECEELLAPVDDACQAAGDGSQVACDIATVRSTNLEWGVQHPDDAIAVRHRAAARAANDDARALLRAGEAAVYTFTGRPGRALELLADQPVVDDLRARVQRAIAESPALAFGGRTADAFEVARAGFEEHGALGDAVALANPGSHVVAQVLALQEAGRLGEALELANFVYEIAVASGIAIPRMWGTIMLAKTSLLQGHPATARRWFLEAVAIAGETGFRPIRRIALSGLATASALLGDAANATAAADELDATLGDHTFVAPELWLGAAWAAVARHEPARARDMLAAAAEEAETNGHLTSASWLLHDVARLGAPDAVAAPLGVLADRCDGELVGARAAHAAALAGNDGDALAVVAEQFAAIGADLAAAEAATAAIDAYKRASEQRRAAAMQEVAAGFVARCEGAQTPGLVAAETVVPLTRREREIALLAADGLASKDIGERLFLSARTVDNHLQRVYTKLGVSRRNDLGDALRRRGELS